MSLILMGWLGVENLGETRVQRASLPPSKLMTITTSTRPLTDAIRLYAVFGAFILGTAMPWGEFADQVRDRLEFLTTDFLLPMFFVYSGLSTKITLLTLRAINRRGFFNQ